MIHGDHLIWGTYGFWLPNDPGGSWSDYVFAWELAKFGKATKSIDRADIAPEQYARWREKAGQALKYPPVILSGNLALEVANGFEGFIEKNRLNVWAFSILPDRIHFVLGRHRYRIETAANLLKGAATRRLLKFGLQPMLAYRGPEKRLPSMWAEKQWIVYLDSEIAIENAMLYVEQNPEREGKPRQRWPFVQPFTGIPTGGWTTYH